MIHIKQLEKLNFALFPESYEDRSESLEDRVDESARGILGISNISAGGFRFIRGNTTTLCAKAIDVKYPFLICREVRKPVLLPPFKEMPHFVVGMIQSVRTIECEPDCYVFNVDLGVKFGVKRAVLPSSYEGVEWEGKKIACLVNLKKECVHDLDVHVACFTDNANKNVPYSLTSEEAQIGEDLFVLAI
jgi:hypothetical protein